MSTNIFSSQKRLKIVKTEDDTVPLPNPYPLPKNYPYNLQKVLVDGQLSQKQKQKFLTELASSMLRYKRFPTRDDYVVVSMAIISKYPLFNG